MRKLVADRGRRDVRAITGKFRARVKSRKIYRFFAAVTLNLKTSDSLARNRHRRVHCAQFDVLRRCGYIEAAKSTVGNKTRVRLRVQHRVNQFFLVRILGVRQIDWYDHRRHVLRHCHVTVVDLSSAGVLRRNHVTLGNPIDHVTRMIG